LLVACGDDGGDANPDARSPDARQPDAGEETLFDRLGGQAGIQAVIDDFLGRVLENPKINGYFLNEGANYDRLSLCLVKQVSAAAGAPGVTYPQGDEPADADGCRNMKESHTGAGISQQDFDDLASDLVAAMTAKGVAQADRDAVVAAIAPLSTEIVEDVDNNATVYQRVGRRPAIETVIDNFVTKVVANAEINGFFEGADADAVARLKVCLVRQVCSIDGPCAYGSEVANGYEAGVAEDKQCRGMLESHQNLTDPDGNKISIDDFNALVGELVATLDEAGVAEADKNAILGALGPLCNDIVHAPTQGSGCPASTGATK
jgi:hemoglobin